MRERRREAIANWLIVTGAMALFGSLFLTWSHQFSPPSPVRFGSSDAVRGVPKDPTAWQVYSAADVLLALLSAGLVVVAVAGARGARAGATGAAVLALTFTLHAVASPPSNGANIFDPSLPVPDHLTRSPGAGPGETVAILALVVALVGLALWWPAVQRPDAPT